MKNKWVYVAWIRDYTFPEGDQDAEYCCVVLIEANTLEAAKEWGDIIYNDALTDDDSVSFLYSEVHTQDDELFNNDGNSSSNNSCQWADTHCCSVGEKLPIDLLY